MTKDIGRGAAIQGAAMEAGTRAAFVACLLGLALLPSGAFGQPAKLGAQVNATEADRATRGVGAKGSGGCAIGDFWGDLPSTLEVDVVIKGDRGRCGEKIQIDCNGGIVAMNYDKPGGGDRTGMPPNRGDNDVSCGTIEKVTVSMRDGRDTVDFRLISSEFPFPSYVVKLGNGSDRFLGSYQPEVSVRGGTGNDNLKGFDGDDGLYGDDGNDYIAGGNGVDTVEGGPGKDCVQQETGTCTG